MNVQLTVVPVPGRVQSLDGETEVREGGLTLRLPAHTSGYRRVQPDRPGFAATFMIRSGERVAEVGVVIDQGPTGRHADITGPRATPSLKAIVDRFPNDWDFYLWLHALTEDVAKPEDSDQWVLWHVFNRLGSVQELCAVAGPDTRVLAHARPQGNERRTLCVLKVFDVAGESRGSITARFAGEVPADELRTHLLSLARLVVIEPRETNPATQPAAN